MSTPEEIKAEVLPEDYNIYDLSFKMIVIGDAGVGKSCLTTKAAKGKFEEAYSATVGFEFLVFNVKLNDKVVKLQIWDTCGQEVYRSLISSFYRSASLAIIVYSIDNENSFNNIEKWLNDIKSQSSPDVKIFLIGNKVDLADKRKVTREAGQNFANAHNVSFFTETSAKTGLNVQNVFIEAAKVLYTQYEEIKNRISRPGSWSGLNNIDEDHNKIIMENEDEETRKSEKKCCF